MPPLASADEGCRGPGAGCCTPTWEEAAPGNKAGKARSSGHLNGPRGTLLEQTLASVHGSCLPELCDSEYYFPAPGVWSGSQQPRNTHRHLPQL